jgi:hydroxymethylglutaryl-CoA synthase
MAGIVSHGAYVPRYRLSSEIIAAAWGERAAPGCRAVANADEDSLTLATEAALDALLMREGGDAHFGATVDALIFASTTSPYLEKQASATIAWSCDLRRDMRTHDIANSLRAGTQAVLTGLDSIAADSARQVLVTSADLRNSAPKSAGETSLGDGAGALILGKEKVIAELVSAYSMADEITDSWRGSTDPFARSWEERFAQTKGYLSVVPEAVRAALAQAKISPQGIDRVVGNGPDRRTLASAAKAAGLDPAKVVDHLFGSVGNTGTSMPLLVLSHTLESASPGEKILLFSYGNGADVLLFEVTPEIDRYRRAKSRGVSYYMARSAPMKSYEQFMKFRNLISTEGARRDPPSASAVQMWRDRDTIYRLYGMKCKACGTLQYPPQRVCYKCRATDQGEPVRFSDKKSTLFTFTLDYLNADIDPPSVMSVINFEGGGRMYCMMTDRDPEKVAIGMPLEMTFRKIYEAGGFKNYYWKCRPVD